MLTLMIAFVAFGLLLAAISVPMILGKIPPNGLYGFRVKKTMENPEIWYKVNAYSGKWLFAASLVQAAASAGLYFLPGLSLDGYAYTLLAVWMGTFSVAMIFSVKYLRSL